MFPVQEEVEQVQSELRAFRRELKKMHGRNDLYLRDLETVYDGAVKSALYVPFCAFMAQGLVGCYNYETCFVMEHQIN